MAVDLPAVAGHLRVVLGDSVFTRCVATGAAMDHAEAVRYARAEIASARTQLAEPT
jgi:hypothetical protein